MRFQTGDIVMFYQSKRFISYANVTFMCQNRDLALNLWQSGPDGVTWEYIYFLNDLHGTNINVEEFNEVVGYSQNFTPQGLMVLDQRKSDLLIERYGLGESNRSLTHHVDAIDAEPDNPRMSNVRGEQSELRRRLLRGRVVAPCSICGENLHENLLVAAHIKKRADCSREEKLDSQVAALMCKLGCDALYEYGYISVEQGVVKSKGVDTDPPRITRLLNQLHDRTFPGWTEKRAGYFAWHTNNVLRDV